MNHLFSVKTGHTINTDSLCFEGKYLYEELYKTCCNTSAKTIPRYMKGVKSENNL